MNEERHELQQTSATANTPTAPTKIVLVVGKTGGHVYPALAVARAIRNLEPGAEILFVCPKRRFVTELVEKHGYKTTTIRASRLVGGTLREKLAGTANAMRGLVDARKLLADLRPDAVVGFGSYLTPPMILAARSLRIFTAIQEQNSIPGWANRVAGPLTHINFLSFEQSRRYFPKGRNLVIGNPIRAEIAEARPVADPQPPFTLLVLGGSQGARFLNTRLPKVLTRLLERRDLRVVHQTGVADFAMVEKLYSGYEDRVTVRDFLDDIAHTYRGTHLAICRAGAGVVFELMAVGIPGIYVPFPFAASNHQFHNARALATNGASMLVTQDEFDARRAEQMLDALIDDPATLAAMRTKLRVLANPYAAEQIAQTLVDELRKRATPPNGDEQ